jgi:hypothetical protein
LVIRVSRDPAENTSTSPLGLALAELEEEALAGVDEVDEGVLEEELLQPAVTSPMQAIDTNAAICVLRR